MEVAEALQTHRFRRARRVHQKGYAPLVGSTACGPNAVTVTSYAPGEGVVDAAGTHTPIRTYHECMQTMTHGTRSLLTAHSPASLCAPYHTLPHHHRTYCRTASCRGDDVNLKGRREARGGDTSMTSWHLRLDAASRLAVPMRARGADARTDSTCSPMPLGGTYLQPSPDGPCTYLNTWPSVRDTTQQACRQRAMHSSWGCSSKAAHGNPHKQESIPSTKRECIGNGGDGAARPRCDHMWVSTKSSSVDWQCNLHSMTSASELATVAAHRAHTFALLRRIGGFPQS